MLYLLKDRGRTLEVHGQRLAESRSDGDLRWAEFSLYKLRTGQYFLYRVGKSVVFHNYACDLVTKNGLAAVDSNEVPSEYLPCPICKPSRIDPEGLFPEKDRPWHIILETPEEVIGALTRQDRKTNANYLTNVVKELLADASQLDESIKRAYMFERIG